MCAGNLPRGRYVLAIGLSAVISFLMYAPPLHADSITIDSFNDPVVGTPFFVEGLPLWGNSDPFAHEDKNVLEVIGGERDILVDVMGTASPISAAGIIAGPAGLLQLATFGVPGTKMIATYNGVNDVGLGGVDVTDSGANSKFVLRFNSIDAGDAVKLDLKVTVGSTGHPPSSKSYTVDESTGWLDRYIPFSDFAADLTSVTSLEFAFNDLAVPNVDFELDLIEAVPEPSTLALLFALGAFVCVAGAWRRRKR